MSVSNLHDAELEPKTRIEMIDGEPERMVNIDGVIRMARDGGTPRSRQLYRMYRRAYRKMEGRPISDQKRREDAMISAIRDLGIDLNFINKSG